MKSIWGALLLSLTCALSPALAQDAKSLPANSQPMPPANWLFVQVADSVTISGNKMTLKGVAPQTVMFADRPERMTGDTATADFVKFWTVGKDSFQKDPPNATVSVTVDGKSDVSVVELTDPELTGDTLTYTIKVLSDTAPKSGESASLFIDWWVAGRGGCYRGPYGGLHCRW
ncbi:hypothetical protein V5G24_17295 [Xanthobacter sp. VTT E-85241]|uniref:hypothetical protein n=1 Tax=Roseixanthobacter finlandensis TaxID=3119922 RepID=UPI0037296926